ncbi:MAG: class II aldolase/adducin family protein [Candidatus Omnitrophica bacterium]|nr:class II aldolase/adducin family protein [Candidatus Omnitrophota bacterium]MDD5236442.1 class II aldolase/adducin family protein [Candidatus Omnitrophota bacterium]MDD5610750.1 class II aldolase/adducin family protein [Candidatus Omnitrophota bacterium]
MILGKEASLRNEIIELGRKLYTLRLVVARSGNLSARLDENNILITATGASLGNLTGEDILKVDLTKIPPPGVTSEFPMHSLIYKNFPAKVIIHCHPTLTNAYFASHQTLKTLTFESKFYLGDIPVVEQETPTVTKPELIIAALKSANLVVLKNHGVVALGEKFSDALYLIEALEEAVKVASVARLYQKDILDGLDKALKEDLTSDESYLMFSKEHIQAIVDLVNKDEFIGQKGKEMDLTLQLAIKLDGAKDVYKFVIEKGKIIRLDADENAPFVISAPRDVWEMVFLGKLDPFVATMQGKMKLKGELGKLSRWYVPFTRLFELFKQVKIK